MACVATALAGCASQPPRYASRGQGGRSFDARLGVTASPRLFEDGDVIPRGGGQYLVGRPYTIAGRAYYPNQRPEGYVAVGTASWYGDAFHGRRTANGEIFDKNSISAAHPTLPLPSYVRVTNLGNNRSMIVRVNDRGPYHGGRVMDVSQRVADALAFRNAGTAHIRIEYVGKASLSGSDDEKLIATLRTDGGPARSDDAASPVMLAGDETPPAQPAAPTPPPILQPAAQAIRAVEGDDEGDIPASPPPRRRSPAPVPPQRPYEVGSLALPPEGTGQGGSARRAASSAPKASAPLPPLISFAPPEPASAANLRFTLPRKPAPTLSAADDQD